MTTPRLQVERLTKRFGPVVASDAVSFDVAPGELHCLLGENGAGKSTLVGCIFGLLQPDDGRILVDGMPVRLRSPAEAARLGIGMVQQHFALIPRFTVLENITVGTRRPGLALERVNALCRDLGIAARPDARVETLSVAEQQWVEILKALYLDARLLLLDEPTAVLTPQESALLFTVIRQMTRAGISVVLISHKFDEVMQADRVTVLRRGRVVATVRPGETDRATLARMMIGHAVATAVERPTSRAAGPPVFEVRDLALGAEPISFQLRQGEILGVAGVAGNGQDELFETLSGGRRAEGTILLDGEPLAGLAPHEIAGRGVGTVPGDRYRDGLVGAFSLAENAMLGRQHHPPFARRGLLDRRAIRQFAEDCVAQFGIVTASTDLPVRHLSGGNAQRLILARELPRASKCLLCHQPTRGLDIGAIADIRAQILAKREAGCAVLLASEDLDELFALSDRILVLFRRRIMGILETAGTDRQRIGLLMAGQRDA